MATTKTAAKKAPPTAAKKTAAKKAPAKKLVAKKAVVAGGAGPRDSAVDMALSIRGILQPEAAGLRAADMTPEERDRTETWFADTRARLGKHMTEIDAEILAAFSGAHKDALLKIKGSLQSDQQILDRREEAFFASGSTQTMKPPSDQDIAKTKELSDKLGEAIAQQKTVEAIVKLVNDLSGLALKVSNPG